jgi:hypothetical protein
MRTEMPLAQPEPVAVTVAPGEAAPGSIETDCAPAPPGASKAKLRSSTATSVPSPNRFAATMTRSAFRYPRAAPLCRMGPWHDLLPVE